uniref:Secreted protein n=1 Tax=Guillardia theta TaxID=55529 RepID=A0A7S4HAC4_GUITH
MQRVRHVGAVMFVASWPVLSSSNPCCRYLCCLESLHPIVPLTVEQMTKPNQDEKHDRHAGIRSSLFLLLFSSPLALLLSSCSSPLLLLFSLPSLRLSLPPFLASRLSHTASIGYGSATHNEQMKKHGAGASSSARCACSCEVS